MESGEEHNYFSSCPRLVATIVGRIDLGYASNLMQVLISLTDPSLLADYYSGLSQALSISEVFLIEQ